MDNVAFEPEIRKSRFLRICPECRTPIEKGQKYAKVCGVYENEVSGGLMCLPCNEFKDRFVQSMQATHHDEVEYHFGDIINEAAEYIDFKMRLPPDLTLAQKRGVLMSLFDIYDGYRKYANDHRAGMSIKARDMLAASRRAYREKAYSAHMIQGMSQCGGVIDEGCAL